MTPKLNRVYTIKSTVSVISVKRTPAYTKYFTVQFSLSKFVYSLWRMTYKIASVIMTQAAAESKTVANIHPLNLDTNGSGSDSFLNIPPKASRNWIKQVFNSVTIFMWVTIKCMTRNDLCTLEVGTPRMKHTV